MECIGFLLIGLSAPAIFFAEHYQWKYRQWLLLTLGLGLGILAEALYVWFAIQGLSLP